MYGDHKALITELHPDQDVANSMNEINKPGAVPVAKKFEAMGFGILATGGTAVLLEAEGVKVTKVLKIHEGRPHIGDLLRSGEVQLMFVTAGYVLNPLALRLLSSRRHLSRAPTAPHAWSQTSTLGAPARVVCSAASVRWPTTSSMGRA